ncbi:MAG: vancomycin permeability regulator SanA [Saprospiraceae bacterium]|jgi:vancomycin permeability regulator SanA
MNKTIKYTVYTLAIWFISHVSMIAFNGISDDDSPAQYTIVFGSKVNEDGTLSKRLAARLDKSVDIYNKGLTSQIFVSGGLGKEGFKEGTKMQEYLVEKGIPIPDILIDNMGNTTRLTAVNFAALVSKTSSVIVVSQFFHVPRCKMALKQVGFQNVFSASPSYYEVRDFISISREFFAYYKYLFVY